MSNSNRGWVGVERMPELNSEAITENTVGHSCTSSDTDSCDDTMTCAGDAGSEMCVCKAGTTGSPGNSCVTVTPTKVGAACTDGSGGECVAHATCSAANGFCECDAHYNGVTGGECYPGVGRPGGACIGAVCVDPHAECPSSTSPKSCVCADDYVASAGVCVKTDYKDIDESCVVGNDACVHATLLLACDPVAGECLIQAGQGCSADGYANLCVSGADCTTNLCTCGTAYTRNADSGLCGTYYKGLSLASQHPN
ncbi:fibropellin-3-like [Littorina saxatilis]|uniref:fibropellin-3-like n=1 Tax=Littorina saxatilis TaxID=31220 RepID=UPI0038B47742